MRGYHVRIRVTAQSTSATAPTRLTRTTKTGKPTRAAWTTETFIPKSIFESLPSHTPRKTPRNNATFSSKRRDYRYGPIRIDWLDLKSPSQSSSSMKELESSANGGTMDSAIATGVGGNGKEKDLRGRGWVFSFHLTILLSRHPPQAVKP